MRVVYTIHYTRMYGHLLVSLMEVSSCSLDRGSKKYHKDTMKDTSIRKLLFSTPNFDVFSNGELFSSL